MSNYVITVDDAEIERQVTEILNSVFNRQLQNRYSETGREISAAVKDLVYSHKDEIIERCVNKASAELVRKGLPKLLERMDEK